MKIISLINPTNRGIAIIALIVLLIILLPALTGLLGFSLDNNLPAEDDDDFSIIGNFVCTWTRIPIQQLLSGLMLGLSIFALFVVYLGGRSNHRRFNDRTIDANSFSMGVSLSLKTALNRAVFNFLFFEFHLDYIKIQLTNGFMPILIPVSRRY